ncbi:unnamed protein product [Kuraishia capsulata CBS 1993]|uniref:Exosome complex component RRP45 n=1 Tax=Kuraishia capsulata CBS 1993 TaxID=1382522 RepID=W6MTB4_9ASCO|nr:uncharacterized protein KUCA_T00005641001 [Kuraishia capsulata CBS 1993]CDK29648.1 unnamed protein product [Kuraishia capsulata CBS 1993]
MFKGFEVSSNEQAFTLETLKSGIRFDGRKLEEMRDIDIRLGDEYGYVEVRLGNTKAIVRISAQLAVPFEDRPYEGIFQISTEISPMAGPMFEAGRQSIDEVLISRLVEKAVRRSGALDLESLCIIAGSRCWAVRADVHFLDYDGNFIDATCLAVMVGLSHFKKPDIAINGEEIVLFSTDQRDPVPLSVLHIPLCVTFAFYNPNDVEENIKGSSSGELILVDPTMKEEAQSLGSMTLTLNKNREICQISKAGGLPIDAPVIMDCCSIAYSIVERLTEKIKQLLKDDEAKRIDINVQRALSAANDR